MESRKYEGERNDHMLHYAVSMKDCHRVKGEQMYTLQMDQQLKTKNINVVPGQLFCSQCKAKFLLETGSL